MFRSKSSRLALMAFAFALPVLLGERVPAAEASAAAAEQAPPAPAAVETAQVAAQG